MSGHVFVAHGDLTRLVCDHWLLPVDSGFSASKSWNKSAAWAAIRDGLPGKMPPNQNCHVVEGWTGPCRPWPTNVAGGKTISEAWHAQNVGEFLRRATDARAALLRARPLLALPIVGTGFGGKHMDAGWVLDAVMPVLFEHVAREDVDVVLVAWSRVDFAAAQAARRACLGPDLSAWPGELRPEVCAEARRLALLAAQGRIAVFMGAGVSAGAGFPTWGALLDRMAREVGFTEEERSGLLGLGVLDRATVIGRRIGDRHAIGEAATAALGDAAGHALAHALLSGLPVREFITTNYDQCFEEVSEAVGTPVARLPYAPASTARRWLLKMHGCVTVPEDIVLTREDFMRYQTRSAALAGIVQAMLITRHMLFVGFSLEDDNFRRIVDAVRQALTSADRDELGTVVSLFGSPLMEQIWGDDLQWVPLDPSPAPSGDGFSLALSERAREFEIFLDALSFHASAPSHLLSPRFEGVLTEDEKALREALLTLRTQVERIRAADDDPAAPAMAMVRRLLSKLGG